MVIKLREIYEARSRNSSRLSSTPHRKVFEVRDIYVNPGHVVCLREEDTFSRLLLEADVPDSVDSSATFTRVVLDRGQSGIDLVVEGTPLEIEKKMKAGGGLLHG